MVDMVDTPASVAGSVRKAAELRGDPDRGDRRLRSRRVPRDGV